MAIISRLTCFFAFIVFFFFFFAQQTFWTNLVQSLDIELQFQLILKYSVTYFINFFYITGTLSYDVTVYIESFTASVFT